METSNPHCSSLLFSIESNASEALPQIRSGLKLADELGILIEPASGMMRLARNPKSEARNPKQIRNPKDRNSKPPHDRHRSTPPRGIPWDSSKGHCFGFAAFEFWICFASSF